MPTAPNVFPWLVYLTGIVFPLIAFAALFIFIERET